VEIEFQVWPFGAIDSVTTLAKDLLSEGHAGRSAIRQQLLILAGSFALDHDDATAMVDTVLKNTQPHDWINGGEILDGRSPTVIDIIKPADLKPRYVELGQFCQEMDARLSGAAFLFMAPITRAMRTIDALREKLTAESTEEDESGFPL
jgi:large subunit ribosomal protein L10